MIGVLVVRRGYFDGEELEVGEMIVIIDYVFVGNLIGEMGFFIFF